MAFRIDLKASAEKDLKQLPAKTYQRIIKNLLLLDENPRPTGCKKKFAVRIYLEFV